MQGRATGLKGKVNIETLTKARLALQITGTRIHQKKVYMSLFENIYKSKMVNLD